MRTELSTAGSRPILLILAGEDCRNAIEAALHHAKSTSKPLRVIQILTSDLYCYGHQDLVATRPSKRQFLLHVRDEVLARGKAEVETLEEAARGLGISLEVCTVESEDVLSAALSEARKGYDTVFLPRQKKKLFPLFNRTLDEHLRKKTSSRIIPC